MKVLKNNTVENDDWMKTLPGYKDEKKIHEELAKKNKKKKKGDKFMDSARKSAGV
jgi:hypothetical protein